MGTNLTAHGIFCFPDRVILHERMVIMKKVIALLAVIALSASLAFGVTTAFTSTVGEDNEDVMTVGNVDIKQIEKTRDAKGKLADFRNDKFLVPAVYADDFDLTSPDMPISWPTGGTSLLWDDSQIQNTIDKFVLWRTPVIARPMSVPGSPLKVALRSSTRI